MFSVTSCYEEMIDLLPKSISIIEVCILHKSEQCRLLCKQNNFGKQNFMDVYASTPWQEREHKSFSNGALSTSAVSQVFFWWLKWKYKGVKFPQAKTTNFEILLVVQIRRSCFQFDISTYKVVDSCLCLLQRVLTWHKHCTQAKVCSACACVYVVVKVRPFCTRVCFFFNWNKMSFVRCRKCSRLIS